MPLDVRGGEDSEHLPTSYLEAQVLWPARCVTLAE